MTLSTPQQAPFKSWLILKFIGTVFQRAVLHKPADDTQTAQPFQKKEMSDVFCALLLKGVLFQNLQLELNLIYIKELICV